MTAGTGRTAAEAPWDISFLRPGVLVTAAVTLVAAPVAGLVAGWPSALGVLAGAAVVGAVAWHRAGRPHVRLVRPVAVALAALLRGSYHLYQGLGGFVGNLAMGLLFGWLYRRWGRVTPFVVAHTVLDVGAFVGYAVLAGRVSWLPTL
jgi:hypothetical protein